MIPLPLGGNVNPAIVVLVLVVGWVVQRIFRDPYDLKRIPGPPLTSWIPLWPFMQARLHRYSLAVHEQHEKHGAFIRVAPDHVSIAEPAYIKDVMGHGNSFAKSRFYEIFDWHSQSIFTTRDRAVHTRKRKWLSATFSSRSIKDFERFITKALMIYSTQMEKLIDENRAGSYEMPLTSKIRSRRQMGEGVLDAIAWNAFLAFDVIGDLAFGGTFGYLEKGFDENSCIQVLKDRGEWCVVVGQALWLRPWIPYLFFDSFFTRGAKAVSDLGDICTAAVGRRKVSAVDDDRKDILSYLLQAKDPDTGEPLSEQELTMEALSIFIGGSDTTSNTITHAIDLLSRNKTKLKNLQLELDANFPSPLPGNYVPDYSDLESLPYLEAVIHETLRLRPTISFGLPRVVPPGPGVTIGGKYFKPGTVLSISTYSVHRNREVFGDDCLEFNPDRWLGEQRPKLDKHFMSFSYGPRACIGRNIALMELKKTIATLFLRFNYRLVFPEHETQIREGFHLKCTHLPVFISRRTHDSIKNQDA